MRWQVCEVRPRPGLRQWWLLVPGVSLWSPVLSGEQCHRPHILARTVPWGREASCSREVKVNTRRRGSVGLGARLLVQILPHHFLVGLSSLFFKIRPIRGWK